jgi:hypothetical protein
MAFLGAMKGMSEQAVEEAFTAMREVASFEAEDDEEAETEQEAELASMNVTSEQK